MDNGHEAATKADLQALRSDIEGLREQIDGLREQIHDTETKLLTDFYEFAKANQTRVSELEGSDAAI